MVGDNALTPDRNVLIARSGYAEKAETIRDLAAQFFGEILIDPVELPDESDRRIYACGDLSDLPVGAPVSVIRELSVNDASGHRVVRQGQVPLNVHGLGVLFPRFFEAEDLFARISTEHTFQHLTESTKPSLALRRGIYLTDVSKDEGSEDLNFRLMRCSSNLTGPTDNLRKTDREVIDALNEAARFVFDKDAGLNHVLAQIYDNRRTSPTKEKKAKIGAHSDKTKDMSDNAVMAFCTFYDGAGVDLKPSPKDPWDRVYRGQSGMTRLHFKRKKTVEDESLVREFSVTLYPNSVFFMPLSTNRLYTHAIRPSSLNLERVPTRMGYVVRCSSREAVFADGKTYIRDGGELHELQPMDVAGARGLRTTYRDENTTDAVVRYDRVVFSMNTGDYLRPIP